MEIDNDTLELLESRLGDKVETRVRRRLFGIYGAAATAFLAAFGNLGYDTVTTARTAIEKGNAEMQETIVSLRQKAEQYAQDAVADSVASAREAAEDAQQVADTAATRLKVIDEWMAARTLRLAEIEGNVAATLGKVESVTGRIQAERDRMTAKITDTETQITAQHERARELYAGAGNLDGLKSDIATLTDQVAALEQSLHDLRQAGTPGEGTSGEGTTGEGTPDEGTPGDPASLTST